MDDSVVPDWIAVDWGTSNLRAYAMVADDPAPLAEAHGAGMRAIAADPSLTFEAALLAAIGPWIDGRSNPVPIIMCGMVGSRQGWAEARYLALPVDLAQLGGALTSVETGDARLRASIVPGLSQSAPADVMRGEETQLAGYIATGGAANRVCLPGTHSKWVRLVDGAVTAFSTAMTGEVFDLMSTHSLLSHSVGEGPMDQEAFIDAALEAVEEPHTLLSKLFGVRAKGLLESEDGAWARGRLSGLLIGSELAGVRLRDGEKVAIIGAPTISNAYESILVRLGVTVERCDGEAMVLAGLRHLIGSMPNALEVA